MSKPAFSSQNIISRKLLYSRNNGLALLHKYTSTERQNSEPDPRDTATCDTTSIVDGL